MTKYLIISLILFVITTCKTENKYKYKSANCDTLSIKCIKYNILNKPFATLTNFDCFFTKDTFIEEEGIEWKAKVYYYNKTIVFIAETNWEDSLNIHRITILNPMIKDKEIFVGQELSKFIGRVSNLIPNSQDGFMFLTMKEDKSINIQLDISGVNENSSLYLGTINLDSIPLYLKIKSIVIK